MYGKDGFALLVDDDVRLPGAADVLDPVGRGGVVAVGDGYAVDLGVVLYREGGQVAEGLLGDCWCGRGRELLVDVSWSRRSGWGYMVVWIQGYRKVGLVNGWTGSAHMDSRSVVGRRLLWACLAASVSRATAPGHRPWAPGRPLLAVGT